MKLKNKLALFFLGFIVVLAIILRITNVVSPAPGYIKYGNIVYPVLVADTAGKQFTGLSDRVSLGEYAGMYFNFGNPGVYTMVMRDMLFSLDIVWLNGDKVIEIKQNLEPEPNKKEGELTRYFNATEPADSVLELSAGTAKAWGLKVGDKLIFCITAGSCSRE